MEIVVRQFRRGDGEDVTKLLKTVNENSRFSEEVMLVSDMSWGFVALTDDRIVGFGALCQRFVPSYGEITASIEDVVVHDDFREKGIGGKLLDSIINYARELGLSGINLSCNISRGEAKKLYESHGFKRLDSWVYVLLF